MTEMSIQAGIVHVVTVCKSKEYDFKRSLKVVGAHTIIQHRQQYITIYSMSNFLQIKLIHNIKASWVSCGSLSMFYNLPTVYLYFCYNLYILRFFLLIYWCRVFVLGEVFLLCCSFWRFFHLFPNNGVYYPNRGSTHRRVRMLFIL